MLKKIISIFLIFVFTVPFIAVADTYDASTVSGAAVFLESVGLDIKESDSGYVTRAHFTELLIKGLKIAKVSEAKKIFADVDIQAEYALSLTAAAELGIISGSGFDLFNPDEPITPEAAAKMTVSALGYDNIAKAYGGYPTGYMRLAKELDITDGIIGAVHLNKANTASVLYAFLTADLCDVQSVTDSEITEYRSNGKSVLTEYYGLKCIDGIVKTAGFATMVSDESCDDAKITIGSKSFKTDITDVHKYLGLSVTGWYDGDTGVMKHIYISSDNSVVTLNAESVFEIEGLKLKADDAVTGREKSYSLSRSYTLVKNGKVKLPEKSDFLFNDGQLTLIDNDSDNEADVVYIRQAEHMVISHIDIVGEKVYSRTDGGKDITISNDNGFYAKLYEILKDGNRREIEVEELSPEMVLTVYESEDGRFVEAVASSLKLSGVVEETGDDYVIIGGIEYKIAACFGNAGKLTAGKKVSLLLTADKKIAAFSSDVSSDMEYGYMLDFKSSSNGLVKEAMMSLLTVSGEVKKVYLSDKVFIDGNAAKESTDSTVSDLFLKNNLPVYQVIRFSFNSDGKINKIDTFSDVKIPDGKTSASEEDLSQIYDDKASDENSLTRYLTKTKSFWHSSYNVFSPHAVIDGETVIFSVPIDLITGVQKRYDEKNFSVISTNSLTTYGSYTIDAYDMGADMKPGIIVLYSDNVGDSIKVEKRTAPSIVESVTNGYNSDGSETKLITYWNNGRYYKYPLSDDCYASLTTKNAIPSSGDIVRLVVDVYGEIKALEIDAKYNAELKIAEITDSAPSDGQVDHSYYRGRSFYHKGSALSLLIDESAAVNTSFSDDFVNNIAAFTFTSSCKMALYDTATSTVRQASADSIADFLSAGEENASRIVLKCYSHGIQHLFIYK